MILITGGNGFIGSHLVPLIKKKYKGEKIFLLTESKHNLVTKKGLSKIPKNPRLVIHLAGTTDTSKTDQRCNDIGTKNLLEHLTIGPNTHFVFTSSLAIFSGRKNCNKPIDAKTISAASDRYGITKIKAEKILKEAARVKGFKLTILRLPTVWGDNPRKNSFLNFLKGLVKTNSIFSRLNWPGKTGLIYVDDLAKLVVKISQKPPKNPQIIPIAAQNLTLSNIFKILTESQGKEYKQINVPSFIWNIAITLSPYLKYFESILPAPVYNYLWRASIVVSSPLWCKVNVKGSKFTAK
jgi:nucleoside-diphosphate-sugar epimerase